MTPSPRLFRDRGRYLQAVEPAAGFKKTFNNLAGRSKTRVPGAQRLRVEGQSPVELGGLRCFTAFLSASPLSKSSKRSPACKWWFPWLGRNLKVLILLDHALARSVLRHVVRPVVLAGADALVFVIKES